MLRLLIGSREQQEAAVWAYFTIGLPSLDRASLLLRAQSLTRKELSGVKGL